MPVYSKSVFTKKGQFHINVRDMEDGYMADLPYNTRKPVKNRCSPATV